MRSRGKTRTDGADERPRARGAADPSYLQGSTDLHALSRGHLPPSAGVPCNTTPRAIDLSIMLIEDVKNLKSQSCCALFTVSKNGKDTPAQAPHAG